MFRDNFKSIVSTAGIILFCASCGIIPKTSVWLKSVSFQVDQQANGGSPFVCHIVVPYSKDLLDRVSAMDAKSYFNSDISKINEHSSDVQIFRYDLIPGKNVIGKAVNIRSYTKAMGAFLFAKYSRPGKFTAKIGASAILAVRCTSNNIQVLTTDNLTEVFGADAR